jgi:hypothetical protein
MPQDPRGFVCLADVYDRQGKTSLAVNILQEGLLAMPDHPELLAEIRFYEGKLDKVN